MFYCHVFHPENSGYSNAFQNLINSILKNDNAIEIEVVTPYPLKDGAPELQWSRLAVHRLKPILNIKKIGYFINEFLYAKAVSRKFKKEAFDLLVIETFDQAFFINSLDRDLFNSVAVRIHATNETEYTFFSNRSPHYRLRRFLIKYFLIKKVNWFLSTNEFHIKFIKKYFFNENLIDIGNKSFFVLPNPVKINPPDNFSVNGKIKIFSLGRMDYLGNNQKGFIDLIYALKILTDNVRNKFEIKIVGKGDMRDSLINLCKDMSNILFIQEMTHGEIIDELKKSDAVILPSRYEGLSMFALEGLSTGNACIFSRTGGLIDLMDRNGIFFEPQNVESIVSALVKLANLDLNELAEMKKRSITITENKFSSIAVAKKFSSIVDLIITCKK